MPLLAVATMGDATQTEMILISKSKIGPAFLWCKITNHLANKLGQFM